jgi:hypothetical protein
MGGQSRGKFLEPLPKTIVFVLLQQWSELLQYKWLLHWKHTCWLLRWVHTVHAPRIMRELIPCIIMSLVALLTLSHQSKNESSVGWGERDYRPTCDKNEEMINGFCCLVTQRTALRVRKTPNLCTAAPSLHHQPGWRQRMSWIARRDVSLFAVPPLVEPAWDPFNHQAALRRVAPLANKIDNKVELLVPATLAQQLPGFGVAGIGVS